jgi:predicted nucleotidyltransferase/predicted transcriptional regulator with HTH domain
MIRLRSQPRRRLLAYYFTNPDANHYVRELARLLRVDVSNLARELAQWEKEGLFVSQTRGRQKYYRLNRDYPLYAEVRGIVMKTAGVEPQLKQAFQRLEGIEQAVLYGSFAKGRPDAASDIDLLVIGAPDPGEMESRVRRLERLLGREINYTVLTRAEFNRRRKQKDPFLEDVFGGKHVALAG